MSHSPSLLDQSRARLRELVEQEHLPGARVSVLDGRRHTEELIDASDIVLLTGTTLVNGTFDPILARVRAAGKRCLVYGVTAAGVCALSGIERICPRGRDG